MDLTQQHLDSLTTKDIQKIFDSLSFNMGVTISGTPTQIKLKLSNDGFEIWGLYKYLNQPAQWIHTNTFWQEISNKQAICHQAKIEIISVLRDKKINSLIQI